jgi:hypothetical protein
MKQLIKEAKRFQELAGIKELKIAKPILIKIEPSGKYGGEVYIDGIAVPYNMGRYDVNINLCDSYGFLESIDSPLYNMGDEDGNVNQAMSDESKKVCEMFIQTFKNYFNYDVKMRKDGYGIFYLYLPIEVFYKRAKVNTIVKQINNDTFEYKNKIIKIKKIPSTELEQIINEFVENYYNLYPHTINNTDKEKLKKLYFNSEFFYYVLNDKGNYLINKNPKFKNKPTMLSHEIVFGNNSLDLIQTFKLFYPEINGK